MRGSLPPTRFTICLIAATGLLAACSNYTGDWPQLGPTVQDTQPTLDDTVQTAQVSAPGTLTDDAALDALSTRLSQVTVGYADAKARAQSQRAAVSDAVAKAGNVTGANWSRAQLELSRLNQIEAELSELRDDASGIAGDLASMAAKGMPVSAQVSRTGTLINVISKEIDSIAETRLRARNTLNT